MEKENCPHCGARWFIEEFNYTVLKNFDGYIIDGEKITLETSATRIESSFTQRCLACGYHINLDIKH